MPSFMDMGVPKPQGQRVVFPDLFRQLTQERDGNTQNVFPRDPEPGHARDVAFVLERLQFGDDLLVVQRGTNIPIASESVFTPKTSIGESGKSETAFKLP